MRVFTVGHSTRTTAEFTGLLQAYGVRELLDVRALPSSARHPHFSQEPLARALAEAGVRYTWLGHALGGYRKRLRADSPHTGLRSAGFRNYADHMEGAAFRAAVDGLLGRAARAPTALMCAERHWSRCHRSLICDHLVAVHGVEVVHILDADATEPHRLHETARAERGRVVYDRETPDDPRQASFF